MANIQKKYIILSSIVVVLAVILILTVTLKNKGYSLPQFKTINTQLSEITITRNGNETIPGDCGACQSGHRESST